MGSQQLVLVVLGVIIVAIATAVGMSIFFSQAFRTNRNALASEVQVYAAESFQYYRLPVNMGGAGQNLEAMTVGSLARAIGFSISDPPRMFTEHGEFRIMNYEPSTGKFSIVGLGNSLWLGKLPKVKCDIELPSTHVVTEISAATGFD